MESPAVVHFPEWSFEIFDQNFKPGPIERHAAREGFVDKLVGNSHVGDDGLSAVRFRRALAHVKRPTQGNEFRITFNVGNKLEHVGRGMLDMPLGRELRHYRCKARSALRRAKSSPA